MEPFEDDRLVAALESLRPEPRPVFAAELDERAAAGFPRRSAGSALRSLADRLRAIEPRRALIPAGATALAAVAAATAVISLGAEDSRNLALDPQGGEKHLAQPARSGPLHFDGSGRYSGGSNNLYEADAPIAGLSQGAPGAMNSAAEAVPQLRAFSRPVDRSSGYLTRLGAQREIERSAQLVLGADPAEVRKAAGEVFDAVHAYRGVVLSSSIHDGREGEAGARFSLLIPTAKLGDAMADFSRIGEVRSRREATADITAPTVRTGEQLRDSRAKIEGLLAQLSQADADAERAAAEAQLRAERRRAAFLRSQLVDLKRRANLSRVQLRIESGAPAASAEEGGWGAGDALADAGRILGIAAGVAIVGLAVLGPIALLALLAWLANRARIRRARQRALA